MDSQVAQPTAIRLDNFLWCRLISLQQGLNKLLHQIDIACKTGNFVLFKDVLLPSLPIEDDQLDQEAFGNHLRQLINHIAHLFHSNICDSTQSWLIHLIATQLQSVISLFDNLFDNDENRATFDLISDRNYSQLYLICSNHLLHAGLKYEDVLDFYTSLEAIKSSEKEQHIQSMIIKLKNSLFQSSTFTSFVINVFSKRYNQLHSLNEGKLNLFDKIYLQALIHTLKNENKRQMTDILLRCPDAVLHDENLLCQIIEYFQSPQKSSQRDHLLDLYSSCLFRFTPQLITSIYSIRFANLKYRVSFFNTESPKFFNLKECFLLAVHENKHFLAQFCKVYCNNHKNPCDISRLPVKTQILLIVISLYDLISSSQNEAALFIERISRFETNLSNLLLKYECENFDKEDGDQIFFRMVCKLRFVLTFADWCHTHINQGNLDRSSFCYKIIVSLLSGSSPLKILSGHGFLELKPTSENLSSFKEVVYDEICLLISQYDLKEAMVLKGFVILRLIFFCILSKEDENVYFDTVQIKNLIEDIMPIEFRIEIMENIFSLLFLTKSDFNHHFNLNSSEDDDYLDETLSNTRQSSVVDDTNKLMRKKIMSDLSKTTYFLCPNWIIPKILELLKDTLYKTSSDMYSLSHGQADSNAPQVWQKIGFEECKARIAALMRHVGDARFRYDVIRPAFYKNISAIQSSIKAREDHTEKVEAEAEAEGYEDSNQMDMNRDLISAASSDTDHQKSTGHLSTSLISCMLASYTQLLCYTLIENSLENASKIARLFQDDLKNSKELKELQLLEYFSELHSKIGKIQSSFADASTTLGRLLSTEDVSPKFKTGEIANLGIRSSKIQSVVYEMLQKMDRVDNVTKKIFMIDYSLCASPSLEVSQAILEAIFVQNSSQLYQTGTGVTDGQVFPEKVELFLVHFQRLISDLAHSINTSQLSVSDYFQKSLTSSPLLDAKSFITTLRFEAELRRAYSEFYRHLNYLENRLIDDPDLLSASDAEMHFRKDSQLLLTLFDKIADHCPAGKFHYLKTLLLYVRKVSKALVECKKRNLQVSKEGAADSSFIYTASYFSILKQSPSAILCSMVIKSKISPKIIDDMALIMKVNLIGVLCSVYCPSIATCFLLDCNLRFFVNELVNPCLFELIKFYSQGVDAFAERSIQSSFVQNFFAAEEVNASFGDSSFEQSFQPLINNEVLTYFNGKCSVLVELLRILNLINDQQVASVSPSSPSTLNMHIAEQSPLLRWVERIKSNFFYGDATSTISLAFHPRIVSGHPAVIKTLEYCIANQKYKQVYELFRYIDNISTVPADPEEGNSYQLLQDAVFSRLAFIEKNAKFAFQIAGDSKMKCEVVCRLLTYSENYDETFMATRLIRLCLQNIQEDESIFGVDSLESRKKLEKVLCEIEFYAAVGQLTGLKNWKLSKDNLESIDVLTIIKTKKRFHLAIDWYKIKGLEKETCDLHIELLIHAYSELNDYASLRQLFNACVDQLQSADVIAIVEKTLNLVDNLELRSFLVDLLATYYRKRMNFTLVESYEQYKLGIEMVKLLGAKIRGDYLKLASSPVLLIEQLLMNCEIDSLERIINQYKLIQADELVERYAQKSVYIEIYDAHSFNSSADLTQISSSFNDSLSITNRSTNTFVVPEKIPSKDQWVSDAQETHCMICHLVRFSMINRRHHCRRCGRVVCQACSANTFLIPEININSHVRVCNDCYVHLKQKTRRASTHSSNSSTSSTANRRTVWYLLPGDEAANDSRRFEFVYETAPSVTLCLAILHLHSDQKRCCKFIIDKICAPLLETTDSRYVDSTLLIEMIRSLLMSTCISIEEYLSQEHRKERIPEIEQLSLYLDRLDVIRMMINSNYGTKEMIGYVLSNNIQKLQEKLLEMERFELAIDIAKKYGLDSSSIWKTWAIICLKHLQFADARRKFNRYFDQAARASDDQQTLKNIVDILVRSNSTNLQPMSIKEKCNQILACKYDFLSDRTDLVHPSQSTSQMTTPSAILQQRSHLKPRIYQEIVYYIKQYGTADDLLHFYVEHHYWKEAVEYFIGLNREQAASANTCSHFLNSLFIPAQTRGSLGAFFAAIRQSDPQLAVLWSSLIAICRHLAKNEFFNSLYRVQIFMSDYLRAAITQINCFFLSQRTASSDAVADDDSTASTDMDSFDLLYRRITHLEKARDNCNMYLHNVEYVKLKPGCLHVEKKDVLKQIRLIEVQIDILKRFKLKRVKYPLTSLFSTDDGDHQPSSNRYLPPSGLVLRAFQSELAVSFTGRSHFPPTLLEHDLVRKSQIAALMILYFSDSLEEGFRHSLRIIQEHQLNRSLVYKMTAGFLLAHELEKNSSAATMLDLLGQLLVYVRSSCMAEHNSASPAAAAPSPGDPSESGFFSNPLTASRSMSFSRTMSQGSRSAGTPPPPVSPGPASLQALMNKLSDEIVTSCIGAIKLVLDWPTARQSNSALEQSARAKFVELSESLIKLLSDDKLRIEAYLQAGKLKLAYLLAVSLGQRSNVIRVLDTARQSNDQHYVKICEMWLRKNVAAAAANQ